MKHLIENDIEEYLVARSEEEHGMCYKFISPQNSGVPDRILIIKGFTIFIETKAPGKTPRLLQKKKHEEMKRCGATVITIDSKEQIDKLFELLKSKKKRPALKDIERISK